MNKPQATVAELQEELKNLKNDLAILDTDTLGDRRNREKYKHSLQGRIETMEGQVGELAEAVNVFRGSFNKGVSGFLMAILGAAGFWVFNKLTGGP